MTLGTLKVIFMDSKSAVVSFWILYWETGSDYSLKTVSVEAYTRCFRVPSCKFFFFFFGSGRHKNVKFKYVFKTT